MRAVIPAGLAVLHRARPTRTVRSLWDAPFGSNARRHAEWPGAILDAVRAPADVSLGTTLQRQGVPMRPRASRPWRLIAAEGSYLGFPDFLRLVSFFGFAGFLDFLIFFGSDLALGDIFAFRFDPRADFALLRLMERVA
jgi:hypothetical protein